MKSRPTGTVTFLFTDIEGSTRMWEEHRTVMRDALQRHDDIVRAGIEQEGGYVFSTAGDAFSAAFSEPVTAVESAIAVQRRLIAEDWGALGDLAVRFALHTGVAYERDGDYFGPTLNRTARMLAAGHGGQILTSRGTAEVLGESLVGVTLRDLGEHTLKDLGRPERIFQVAADGLRDDFPPLQSINAHPNNLPIQLTSFVGRELELNEVVKRLHDHRLLTLTGVGGSGKTRLAIQAAAESIADHPQGVWLVELASVGDPDLIAGTIGETLGLTRSQGGSGNSQLGADPASSLDQVTGHLRTRTVLLLLDNCEHLITSTARMVQHLLQNCPNLTVLATSREGLGVPGEALWQVPSLSAVGDGDALASDAVRLFVERAQDANARFEVDPSTLHWVRRICERLDGMPLAIELAAARARVLDAKQIAERLDDRFRLLTGGSRTALPRHQTLEATVDWSYDLMSPAERIVFQRLAAFRGGFTLEAAEAICAGDDAGAFDVLDLVGRLVDKSMVVRDDITGRFRMLETLRQYALRKLTESAEVDAVRKRHATFFCGYVETEAPHLHASREAEAYEAITRDHDNLRSAMAFGLENHSEATAVRIAASLAWYWWASSDTNEGLDWLRKVMPHVETVDVRTACGVLAFASLFAGFRKDPDARILADDAIARAREAGDDYAEAMGYMALAFSEFARSQYDAANTHALDMVASGEKAGDQWMIGQGHMIAAYTDRMMSRLDEAAQRLVPAEVAFRKQQSPSGLAWCLVVTGQVARYRFEFETEIRKQVEARKIFAVIGAPFEISMTLLNEAIALTLLGRAAEAVILGRRAVAMERELSLNDQAIEGLVLLGWFEHEAGNGSKALDLYEEAFRLAAPGLDRFTVETIAEHLALQMSSLGKWEEAARLDGYHNANISRPEPEIYARHYEPYRMRYRDVLGDRTEAILEEGAAMSSLQLQEYGLSVITQTRHLLPDAE